MKLQKKLIVVCLAVFFCCVVFIGCGGKKEINLNDYVSVEFSGYDGYGEATVVFDMESLEMDCEKIKFTNDNVESIYSSVADYYIDFCVFYSLNEKEDLSNGDTITLTWNCESGFAENNTTGTLVNSEMTFNVSGLEVASTFDLFEGVTLEYEGISPLATVSVTGGREDINYYIERDNPIMSSSIQDVKNGDIITVRVNQEMTMEEMVEVYGGIPESMTKEFEVSGVDEYISKLNDVSDDDMSVMDSEARYIIEDYQNQFYGYQKYEVKLIEKAVGTPELFVNGRVCLIYSLSDPEDEEFKFYWCAEFPDVVKKADGSLSYDVEKQDYPYASRLFGMITGEGFVKNDEFHVGYETLEMLKEDKGMDSGNWDCVVE